MFAKQIGLTRTSRSWRFLILLYVLLSSGCFLLGPKYGPPKTNILKQWPTTHNVTLNEHIYLPGLAWWKQYQSPELDELINRGLKTNNDLNIAMTNIDYAHSELNQIKLNWLPTLSFFGGYSQFPMYGNPGNFIIAFPLYTLNLIQQYKQQKSAEALYEASIYAKDAARLLVIAQVATGFFTLIAQNETLEIYNQLLKDHIIYLNLAKSQYRHGLVSQDQIEQLNSQINLIHSQINLTHHNIVISKNALHYLLNENPGDIDIKTPFKAIHSNQIIPSNLPVTVLNHRPDIRQAERLLKAAHADIGAITATLLPTVSLGAYLGYSSSPILKNPVKLGQAYLSTPVLDLPIFAAINASKALYRAMCIKYVETIRAALRDVDNDLSAYSSYASQLHHNTRALLDEKRLCHLVNIRYRHGINNQLDVIQCKIRLDQFALMVNQDKLKKMLAVVTLYQDLAGGYRDC